MARALSWCAVAGLVFSVLSSPSARAAGPDAEAGHAVARRWCASCHQVDSEDPANGVASSFQMMAKTNQYETGWMRSWQHDPHPRIQGVVFTKFQIDALTAYLKSIRAD